MDYGVQITPIKNEMVSQAERIITDQLQINRKLSLDRDI